MTTAQQFWANFCGLVKFSIYSHPKIKGSTLSTLLIHTQVDQIGRIWCWWRDTLGALAGVVRGGYPKARAAGAICRCSTVPTSETCQTALWRLSWHGTQWTGTTRSNFASDVKAHTLRRDESALLCWQSEKLFGSRGEWCCDGLFLVGSQTRRIDSCTAWWTERYIWLAWELREFWEKV